MTMTYVPNHHLKKKTIRPIFIRLLVFALTLTATVAVSENCSMEEQLVMNKLGHDFLDIADQLAKPFHDANTLPGMPGGIPANTKGRFIVTGDINSAVLPGDPYVRPVSQKKIKIPQKESEFKTVHLEKETDIYLMSADHSGSSAAVFIGKHQGKAVAVRVYRHDGMNYNEAQTRESLIAEAKGAYLLGELGIGPKFHGLVRDSKGRIGFATDIIAGDSVGMTANWRSIQQIEIIMDRIQKSGRTLPGDFQFNISAEGNLSVFDPGMRFAQKQNYDATTWQNNRLHARVFILRRVAPELRKKYLSVIQKQSPKDFKRLDEYYRKTSHSQDGWYLDLMSRNSLND